MMKITKTIFKRILWLGRGTATTMGVAVMFALTVGLASTALAAVPGDPFKLGKTNTMDKITTLAGSVNKAMLKIDNNSTGESATALDLQVKPGKAPMQVDSGTKVVNLNSDELDGKSASEIGINGLEQVSFSSPSNSDSSKISSAVCPEGKVVVGSGYSIAGGKSGSFPNVETDVVVDTLLPNDLFVTATAFEGEPTSANWSLTARAICATAP